MGNTTLQTTGGGGQLRSSSPREQQAVPQSDFKKQLLDFQKAQNEYEYLAKLTHFDETTLRLLHLRFSAIDQIIKDDGRIDIDEFAHILEMKKESLLLKRFFKFMDKSDIGNINFRNFAITMSMLSTEATVEEKMELSFFLYDLNQDGYIDQTECKELVIAAALEIDLNLNNSQVDEIVKNTFKACDLDKDNKINFKEYCDYCKANPRILQPFTIDISNLIQYEQENRRQHRYSGSIDKKRKLHHGPNVAQPTDKNTFDFGKVKKKLSNYSGKDKFERVRSIHNVVDLVDEEVDSSKWGNKSNSSATSKLKNQTPLKTATTMQVNNYDNNKNTNQNSTDNDNNDYNNIGDISSQRIDEEDEDSSDGPDEVIALTNVESNSRHNKHRPQNSNDESYSNSNKTQQISPSTPSNKTKLNSN